MILNSAFAQVIALTPDGIELFIQLTDAAEMVHHTDIQRHTIMEKLAALPRAQINLLNEALRQWKEETKVVTNEPA